MLIFKQYTCTNLKTYLVPYYFCLNLRCICILIHVFVIKYMSFYIKGATHVRSGFSFLIQCCNIHNVMFNHREKSSLMGLYNYFTSINLKKNKYFTSFFKKYFSFDTVSGREVMLYIKVTCSFVHVNNNLLKFMSNGQVLVFEI